MGKMDNEIHDRRLYEMLETRALGAFFLWSGCNSKNCANDEEATASLHHGERSVAVFYVHPPGLWHPAVCPVKTAESNDKKIQDDPISLCMIGGLQQKFETFCLEYSNTSGAFVRYRWANFGLWVGIVAHIVLCAASEPICCMFFLAIALLFWFLFWLVVQHKKSTKYLNSKRDFWKSWDFDLESMLNQCMNRSGYRWVIEDQPYCRKFTLCKKESSVQSLPPSNAANDTKEEVDAQAYLRFMLPLEHRVTFGHHHCNYLASKSNQDGDQLLPSDVNNSPPFPMDSWTTRNIREYLRFMLPIQYGVTFEHHRCNDLASEAN